MIVTQAAERRHPIDTLIPQAPNLVRTVVRTAGPDEGTAAAAGVTPDKTALAR
ncbi:MAG: hypothetical protein OHK0044_27510 [Burkholderiaceae bacterium]